VQEGLGMRALILDMYGVIMKDPEGGFIPFVNRTFPDLSRDDVYLHWNKADVGELSSLDLFRKLGFEGNLSKIEKEYLDTVEINESFYEIAPILKKHYHLALLSNDSSEWSRYLRDKFKINDYFDVITVSGDVKIKKPDVQIFMLTLDKLRHPASDCIYVDDRRFNLAAAESLGMDTVLFNSRNVQYEGKTVVSFKELANMLIHS
jgi:putative hydrolase of the HAD superfamily